MKIKDLLEHKEEISISFGRLQLSYSYEDSLEIFETYYTKNVNLNETNDSVKTKFFLNLENISTPVPSKQYITCLLSLVNNKLLKTNDIIVGTFVKEEDSIYYIEDRESGHILKYPRERIGNMIMKTFFFEDVSSYNKFRTIIALKFDTSLPDMNLNINEAATAGATSSGSIATIANPHLSPGKARGKKSYTGTPGNSGTKSPPQPKPKNQTPTDNALDMKGTSIFGGPALKR